MGKKHKSSTSFVLEGRFLTFDREDSFKIKRLQLATADGAVCIKLTKEARASVGRVMVPGDWIQVWGEKTVKAETGETRFKAHRIVVAAPGATIASPTAKASQIDRPIKQQILVCQKSDCIKRGAGGVCRALEAALDDRGLGDHVKVRGTGCMKQCKAGPNLVMPDKTRYSRLTAADIPALVDKHFSASASESVAESIEV